MGTAVLLVTFTQKINYWKLVTKKLLDLGTSVLVITFTAKKLITGYYWLLLPLLEFLTVTLISNFQLSDCGNGWYKQLIQVELVKWKIIQI